METGGGFGAGTLAGCLFALRCFRFLLQVKDDYDDRGEQRRPKRCLRGCGIGKSGSCAVVKTKCDGSSGGGIVNDSEVELIFFAWLLIPLDTGKEIEHGTMGDSDGEEGGFKSQDHTHTQHNQQKSL
ncbi:hypothetical protein V8G54_000919 [Vigna mungo]|uniref:Uncharacterized protein n=1 Tax=Vigna mungo TaxID=3915 RepID=A0AAQ3P798_VIGMU